MADPRGPAAAPRRDLPRRSLYPAEADEGLGQAGLHPVLHLLHVADAEMGAGTVSQRADALSGTGFLPTEFLRQHPGYPALASAERRAVDVQVSRGAGRDAVRHLWYLQRLRTARTRTFAGQGRISRFGKIRDQGARLGQA